jgi:hypothetical protein
MSEHSLSTVHWLHGLENYFDFVDDQTAKNYVSLLLRLLYAKSPIISVAEGDQVEFISNLRKFAPNPALDKLQSFYWSGRDPALVRDLFSRGQVQSKIWLVKELAKVSTSFDNILIVGGWFGQLTLYLKDIVFNKLFVLDSDREACEICDYVFNLGDMSKDWRVKAVCADVDSVTTHSTGYILDVESFKSNKIVNLKYLPDLIINSSAEHMSTKWFDDLRYKQLTSNPLIVIQSNNMFDVPDHINCVHSISHMKKIFPMKEVLFEGELELQGFKRFMLIGRV